MDFFAGRIQSVDDAGDPTVNLNGDDYARGSMAGALSDAYVGATCLGLRINRNTVLVGLGGYYAAQETTE